MKSQRYQAAVDGHLPPRPLEQRFEKGREHTSIYRTPYGNIDLSVRTEALSVDYGEVAGRIDIRYGLWVNGAFQSQNRLHIEIEEDHGL